ncbi:S46 family peptidase [Pseudenhygromyxa sp. WMMC2535]|uniref:S46 family peptidase n=1 Tax=Pseudenhygromyxa sp. WMMC2535 TaxID=2712867 RepID=UPI001595BCCD|nr:S46 family peptidase [Pseudenhygromyxa sp. WMMC2535]NVB37910.1 S46 family peptidase [Pseudenhygromyxa sp. WMMC2535]
MSSLHRLQSAGGQHRFRRSSGRSWLLVPLGLALLASPAAANEGQWKPAQIAEIHERAAAQGLALSAEALWKPTGDEKDGGLMRASVNIGGCSAAFVSAEGLIATNHHCAYGALQANSSVEHDYLKDGFVAMTRAEELKAPGGSVKILRTITDVTTKVQGAIAAVEDEGERKAAFDKIKNELVDACEAAGEDRHCRVAGFFLDSSFELHEYVELDDLRLVYAPPSAIGEYGGETDNWMWPRHTGDFSLLRAYDGDGKPYAPAHWLEPATEGVAPGDFVAVLGYPGRTERYLWAAELERHQKQWLPQWVIMYGEWIDILEAAGAEDQAVGIKVAALSKSLANRHKNARGKIAGLERMKLLEARIAEDEKLAATDEGAKATLEALEALSTARSSRGARAFLIHNLGYGPRSLTIALELVEWAKQRDLPDLERKSGYRDRDRERVVERLDRMAKDHDAGVDAAMLASFLRYADALEGERVAGFDAIMGAAKGAGAEALDAYRESAAAALKGSTIATAEDLAGMLDDPAKVAASKDPMIVLARALVDERAALSELERAEAGRLLRLEPAYFALISKLREQPVYADANATLRLSYATVQGYDKWNGETQKPQTVLAGAVAKHIGEGDFDLPDAVLERAKVAGASRWADPRLGDLPLCFLADGDTTGGNSGSPVINAKGQLVGFNFDRVWENVAGDYAWRPSHSRNVIADARYLYWMLEEIAGAEHLLRELGVADYQPSSGAESAPAGAAATPAADGADAATASSPRSGCGCMAVSGDRGWSGAAPGLGLLLALFAVGGRRRRWLEEGRS